MRPSRCTLLLSIFISTSVHVSGNMCPSLGELTVSMRHWYFSQSEKYQCPSCPSLGELLYLCDTGTFHRVKNTGVA